MAYFRFGPWHIKHVSFRAPNECKTTHVVDKNRQPERNMKAFSDTPSLAIPKSGR